MPIILVKIFPLIFIFFAFSNLYGQEIKPPTSKSATENTLKERHSVIEGMPVRTIQGKIFVKLKNGKEIDLPNPQVSVDEMNFSSIKKDRAQVKAKYSVYATKYIDTFEQEYLTSRGIDKRYTPFAMPRANAGGSLNENFNFTRAKEILKEKMLKIAIHFELADGPALYQECSQSLNKINQLNEEIKNLKSENQNLKKKTD